MSTWWSCRTRPSLCPGVPVEQRTIVDDLGYADGITHVTARFGHMETPDVPGALALLTPDATEGQLDLDQASYFLSKIELRCGDAPTTAHWRKRLFIATAHITAHITADVADYFGLPRHRTVATGVSHDV
jgi:KUP system potassium uptake protein